MNDDTYLQRLKKEIEGKTKEEWIESMKELTEMAKELYAEVVKLPMPEEQISINPTNAEESALLKALLKKMNIPFKSKRTTARKAAVA